MKGSTAASLGTNTKYSSIAESKRKIQAARALRYAALSHARVLLVKAARAEQPAQYPSKVYRTAACRWSALGDVRVLHDLQHDSCHYGNLFVCGSVWGCPVCAAKIQQRRRLEVQAVIDRAESAGLAVAMVTFTFPHYRFDNLDDLFKRQALAFKYLRAGRAWVEFKKTVGLFGFIRSLEVTHGVNGWHPHTHELFICDPAALPLLRRLLVPLWLSACEKAGLLGSDVDAFILRAVDVSLNGGGDYLQKMDNWTIAHELTVQSIKLGKNGSITPFGLLQRQADGDDKLFVDYVKATKGKRQLFFSKGLKSWAGVDDIEDATLADDSLVPADLLGLLDADQWRIVRGNDAQSELLDAAESGGWPAVHLLLRSL